MKVSLLLSDSRHIWPPLAAVHVWRGLMLICVAACTLWRQPLYLIPTGDQMIAGLVSRQAIISPKTRTVLGNDSHQSTIFSAINKKLLLSALFSWREDDKAVGMEERHVVQRGLWRQNNFDKSEIWGHIHRDTKTIKVKLFVGGVAACCSACPCECEESDTKKNKKRKTETEFYLWS